MHRDFLEAKAGSDFKTRIHSGDSGVCEGGSTPGIGLTTKGDGGGASSSEDSERCMIV